MKFVSGLVFSIVRMYSADVKMDFKLLEFEQSEFQWNQCIDASLLYQKAYVPYSGDFILWGNTDDIERQMEGTSN